MSEKSDIYIVEESRGIKCLRYWRGIVERDEGDEGNEEDEGSE